MYDFYQNPPKTKQDIKDYLTSWLENTPETCIIQVDDEKYIQELGFCRASHSHGVFRNVTTNEYIWCVSRNDYSDELSELSNTPPKKRFPNYESLLEYVVDDYYTLWKLDNL